MMRGVCLSTVGVLLLGCSNTEPITLTEASGGSLSVGVTSPDSHRPPAEVLIVLDLGSTGTTCRELRSQMRVSLDGQVLNNVVLGGWNESFGSCRVAEFTGGAEMVPAHSEPVELVFSDAETEVIVGLDHLGRVGPVSLANMNPAAGASTELLIAGFDEGWSADVSFISVDGDVDDLQVIYGGRPGRVNVDMPSVAPGDSGTLRVETTAAVYYFNCPFSRCEGSSTLNTVEIPVTFAPSN